MKYPNEFKQEVLQYYEKNKKIKSIPTVAKKFGIDYTTLFKWIHGRKKNEETLEKDKERAKIRNMNLLSSVDVKVEEELFETFKSKCEELGVSQREVIRQSIEKFIEKKESEFE